MMNMRCMMHKKRGQVWTLDFIIGMMLFLFTIIFAVKILYGIYSPGTNTVVYRDAVFISDNLLSQGYPSNWTTSDVILPGIADNNRINLTKLAVYKNLEYYRAKTLLHSTSDYIFFIRNSTSIINTGQCVYGYNVMTDSNCTPILTNLAYSSLVRIDRVIIYNSTIMRMTVYAWK